MDARIVLLASLAASAASAFGADTPAFKLVRADEDWSVLRDGVERPGVPSFKYLPLSADGEVYVSLGGELRERIDSFDAPRFGIGTRPDTYDLQRILVHADFHFGERARVFVQLGREDAIGKEAPLAPSDTDRGDVQNLFLDYRLDEGWNLRLGRQELIFNPTQRFVSVREGPNVRQSFDGIRATWHADGTTLDLFATRPVEYRPGAFDDRADDAQSFYGAYLSHRLGAATLDVYWLGLERDDVVVGGQHGDERRESVGSRYAGKAGRWDFDLEGVAQFGTFGRRDIRAWAGSAIVGYSIPVRLAPRVSVELDAGSGGSTHGDLETFNPLFPKGAYFNETSLNSWANAIIARPAISIAPTTTLTLQASIFSRWRESVADAVYTQPYAPIRSTTANSARHVGDALQFDATWRPTRSLAFLFELVHQDAGAAIVDAGGHDVDFAMVSAQYRF